MVYEDERIYPPGLGAKIRPPEPTWLPGENIGNIPSALGAGEKGLLPQFFKDVRPIGRYGEWKSLADRPSIHEVSHFSQSIRQTVRERINIMRNRVFNRQTSSILPPAWGPKRWSPGKNIGQLPSVLGIGQHNTRTMHPSVNKGEEASGKVDGTSMSVSGDLEPVSMDLSKDFSIAY